MGNTHKGTKDERDEKKLDNSYITILDSLNAQQVHHEKRIQKADSAIQKLKQNTAACESQIKNNDEKIKKLELKNKEDGLALETHKLHIISKSFLESQSLNILYPSNFLFEHLNLFS